MVYFDSQTNRNEVVSQFGTPKSHEMIYELFFFPYDKIAFLEDPPL